MSKGVQSAGDGILELMECTETFLARHHPDHPLTSIWGLWFAGVHRERGEEEFVRALNAYLVGSDSNQTKKTRKKRK